MVVEVVLLDDPVTDAMRIEDLKQSFCVFGFPVREQVVLFVGLKKLVANALLNRGKHDHLAFELLFHHERDNGGNHRGHQTHGHKRFEVLEQESEEVQGLHGIGGVGHSEGILRTGTKVGFKSLACFIEARRACPPKAVPLVHGTRGIERSLVGSWQA